MLDFVFGLNQGWLFESLYMVLAILGLGEGEDCFLAYCKLFILFLISFGVATTTGLFYY